MAISSDATICQLNQATKSRLRHFDCNVSLTLTSNGTFAMKSGIAGLVALLALCQFAVAGDAAKGEVVFKKCMLCHRIGPDAVIVIGPVLTGVIGRTAGTYPTFAYSPLMKAAGENGLVWTEDSIKDYLPIPTPS
jgi:cytochrome c